MLYQQSNTLTIKLKDFLPTLGLAWTVKASMIWYDLKVEDSVQTACSCADIRVEKHSNSWKDKKYIILAADL